MFPVALMAEAVLMVQVVVAVALLAVLTIRDRVAECRMSLVVLAVVVVLAVAEVQEAKAETRLVLRLQSW